MSLHRRTWFASPVITLLLVALLAGLAFGPAMASQEPNPTPQDANAVVSCILSFPIIMWGLAVYPCMMLLFVEP